MAALRVRMYRVGFGECLLLTFPGPRHMLLDCGSIALSEPQRLARVAEDIVVTTGGHLHVVIASHRHADHSAGFASLAQIWNRVEVDEVWLPWTEDPDDSAAVELRLQQDGMARRLDVAEDPELRRLARNSRTDAAALETLQKGFAGRPIRRYLAGAAASFEVAPVPGLWAQVVGPARSPAELKRLELDTAIMDSTLDAILRWERGLVSRATKAGAEERLGPPFHAGWLLKPALARRLFADELRGTAAPLEDYSRYTVEDVCFWLDRTIDNTSLILLLEFGTARLFLPGDAQGAGWIPFLDNPVLLEKLRRLDFYKVSHHGSHTGTPPRALAMLQAAAAMVSTQHDPWPEIPREPLLAELRRATRLGRTDRRKQPSGFTQTPLWVELELPC